MDNACKYSPEKAVEVRLAIDGKYIKVDFSDNGIGIQPDDMIKIFQPFFRAKNAKGVSGHGLGLSLTEKIVQIHQGEISINSKLNVGTKVTIRIPFIS
jgi:signal transduction histidine kinase